MNPSRRAFFGTGLVAAGLFSTAAVAKPKAIAGNSGANDKPANASAKASDTGLSPDSDRDQTDVLQRLVDEAANRRQPLVLPAGRINFRTLILRAGSKVSGADGLTILKYIGNGAAIIADQAKDLRLAGFVVDGALLPLEAARAEGLITIKRSANVALVDLEVRHSLLNGIALAGSGGRISGCTVTMAQAGIFSLDAAGLVIETNRIASCSDNGILIWRSTIGEDGTIVANNRIEKILAGSGGNGQNGNGINVFRAGNVLVTGNRITDCQFTAVRGNAASNIQMVANNCQRLGEVALYAEFGFEGALIANNLVDRAASGIAVTNFNEGGRLAVVQGNLIRNLSRREHEPQDKRGEGISVEADSLVAGNTIENAPSFGIFIGWGKYMRDVTVTGNLIRKSRIGIGVQNDPGAGAVLIANNMISGATGGAIRSMALGVATGADFVSSKTEGRITLSSNVAS
jgi:uncharacterized secreted repeat protein (TIGR03808 family)